MRVVFTITLLLGSFIAANAQNNGSCGTGSFSFRCPADSNVLLSGSSDGLFVTKGVAPQEIGLFAVEIGDRSADEKLLNDLLDRVFQLLYSRKIGEFQFKESKELRNVPEWRYSKFEDVRYQKVAFDAVRNDVLHTHVVVISADGKRVMAGFVRSFLTGDSAKQAFEGWTMGSGSGPSELQRLLHSISKEENRGGQLKKPMPAV